MMTVYVNWMDEEILSEEGMDKRRKKLLDLTKESGKLNFEEFLEVENCDYSAVLIEIITAEDKQETIDFLLLRYEKYVDNQLDNIYEKIILD